MKNFPFKAINPDTGIEETFWYSRSVAVVGFVYLKSLDTKKVWVLANQRGSGTPDYQGMWNCPCGYLDHNETLEEAVSREVYEETGLNLPIYNFFRAGISSDPSDNKQNVTVRFTAVLSGTPEDYPLNSEHSENKEVMNLAWVPLSELDLYEWAFGHKELICILHPINNELHTLSEALSAIKAGHYAKRQCWPSTILYYKKGDEVNRPCIMAKIWNNTRGPWTATQEDLLADDWIIV